MWLKTERIQCKWIEDNAYSEQCVQFVSIKLSIIPVDYDKIIPQLLLD